MTATPPRPAAQTTQRTPQITLPGQSHTAEGPHDMSGMYLMHHAFRRDLARFVAAVRATPAGDAATWRALAARWRRFTEVLHHHHVAEDELIWPVMLASAEAEGREDDRRTLLDMEAEHGAVDPALERCAAAFADMVAHPCEDHRNALDVRVTTLRELLLAHLRHEETGALPLAQRTMTAEEWAASEKGSEKSYPARLMPFLLAWVEDSLPPEGRHKLVGTAGPVLGLLLRLVVPPYRRRERRAFRYADSAR